MTTTEPETAKPPQGGAWLFGVLAVGLVAIGLGAFTLAPMIVGERAPVRDTLGGPFRLQASSGGVLDSKSLEGKPFLVFFGFTQCPNVCPTTLADLTNLIDRLHKEGGDIRALYITLDPERDTQAVLREYMTSFSNRITGLTGTPEEIARVAQAYRAYAKKVPLPDGDYTIEHTLMVYQMDSKGRFVGPLDLAAGHTLAIAQIKRQLAGSS